MNWQYNSVTAQLSLARNFLLCWEPCIGPLLTPNFISYNIGSETSLQSQNSEQITSPSSYLPSDSQLYLLHCAFSLAFTAPDNSSSNNLSNILSDILSDSCTDIHNNSSVVISIDSIRISILIVAMYHSDCTINDPTKHWLLHSHPIRASPMLSKHYLHQILPHIPL